MTSQPAPLARLVIHRSDQLVLDSLTPRQAAVLVNPTQELKLHRLQALPTPVLRYLRLKEARNIPQVDKLNDQLDQDLNADLQQSLLSQAVSVDNSQVRQVVDSSPDHREDHRQARHHQASKTKARKATTQPFPESQTSTTQSTRRSQRPHSTATSRNSPATTLTSKLAAKSSTSAP